MFFLLARRDRNFVPGLLEVDLPWLSASLAKVHHPGPFKEPGPFEEGIAASLPGYKGMSNLEQCLSVPQTPT